MNISEVATRLPYRVTLYFSMPIPISLALRRCAAVPLLCPEDWSALEWVAGLINALMPIFPKRATAGFCRGGSLSGGWVSTCLDHTATARIGCDSQPLSPSAGFSENLSLSVHANISRYRCLIPSFFVASCSFFFLSSLARASCYRDSCRNF